MAKITKKYSFSKAVISKDKNDKYIITEMSKDDSADYDLSSVLDGMLGLANVSLSIGSDDGIDAVDDVSDDSEDE